MDRRARSARLTPVSDSVARLAIEPLLAHVGDDPLVVARRAGDHPQTRLIGVIDDDGRLVGVVPVARLAEAVIVRLSPEILLAGIADLDDAARFGHAVTARSIGDVMLPPDAIEPTATIEDAFQRMHAHRWSGLYVVDPAGRPTGYLDLLELTMRYVEALESDTPPAG
jgi:CBS domain-containing protein